MSVEDLLRSAATDVASSAVPGLPNLPELRRRAQKTRRIRVAGVSIAVAAVVAVVAIAGPQVRLSSAPEPTDETPSPSPSLTGAVWFNPEGGLFHVGAQSFEAATVPDENPWSSRGEPQPFSWSVVREGVVYVLVDPGRRRLQGPVMYQTPDGEPTTIGNAVEPGPVTDPLGTNAAWFDGRDLIVYDTAAGAELARVDISDAPLGTNMFQPPILYVGPDQVIYEQSGQVWELGWEPTVHISATSRSADEFVDGAPGIEVLTGDRVIDERVGDPILTHLRVAADGRVIATVGPVFGEGQLSADGRYLATWKGYQDDTELVVLDMETGEPLPQLESHYLREGAMTLSQGVPWAWSYDNVLVISEGPTAHNQVLSACTIPDGDCSVTFRPLDTQ